MPIKYLETIINSGLFRYIRKSEYISVLEQLSISERNYAKGDPLFYQGDVIDMICLVESGSVRGEKTYPNGDVHLVAIFEEGSIVAIEIPLSRKKTSPLDLIANENSRLIMISMSSIGQSGKREQLYQALMEMLADDNIRMTNKVEILAERGLRDRVMVYLNILRKKSGSNVVQVRMSREQMAQFLCVNRSALSNELNKMKREGLIDFRRGQFTILDSADLKDRHMNTHDDRK